MVDMATDVSVTFKVDEDMATWLRKAAFEMDKPKSEIIRCCILLSLDTVVNTPSLVNRIQFDDRESIKQR
jgi:hypothetical protein